MNENFNELVKEINNLKLILSGGVKLGSSTNCNSEKEGTIRYNTNFKIVEICDGTSWYLSGGKKIVLYKDHINGSTNNVLSAMETFDTDEDYTHPMVTLNEDDSIIINQTGAYSISVSSWKCGSGDGSAKFVVKRSGNTIFGRHVNPAIADCSVQPVEIFWDGFQNGDVVRISLKANTGGGYLDPTPDGSENLNARGNLYIWREF